MTEQEKINAEVQAKLTVQDEKFNTLIQELHDFKEEMRDFKTEMCQQNQIRAEELREIRQRQDAAQAKHDAEMKEMNARFDAKFDKISEQIHTMTITAVVGFGAIAAAVGGLVFAAFR